MFIAVEYLNKTIIEIWTVYIFFIWVIYFVFDVYTVGLEKHVASE